MAPKIHTLFKRQAEPLPDAVDDAVETTTLHLEHFNKHHRHASAALTTETIGKRLRSVWLGCDDAPLHLLCVCVSVCPTLYCDIAIIYVCVLVRVFGRVYMRYFHPK